MAQSVLSEPRAHGDAWTSMRSVSCLVKFGKRYLARFAKMEAPLLGPTNRRSCSG